MSDSCNITAGRSLTCWVSGGIDDVWLGTFSDNASYAVNSTSVITGATSASTVYKFSTEAEYCGLTSPAQITAENGSVSWQATLTMKFIDLDYGLRNSLYALSKAPIFAVVKSSIGTYYALGTEKAGRASEVTLQLGTVMTDMNGGTISILFKSTQPFSLLDSAVLGTDIPVGA